MLYRSKRFAVVACAIVAANALGIAAGIAGIPTLYALALLGILAAWIAISLMLPRNAAPGVDEPTPGEHEHHRRAAMAPRIACQVFAVVIPAAGAIICIIAAAHSILALAAALLLCLLACSYYFGWTDRLIDAWDKTASYRAK